MSTVDEIRRLLAATVAGPDRYRMPADERALLYRLAVESGLRSNELRSLTRSSFQFGRKMATVTVEAGSSKRRRRDELPLRPDTAALLQSHLASKHPGAAAFSMPKADFIAKMIRADLSAARDAWLNKSLNWEERVERERSSFLLAIDETGHVVDFHALRHTFLTNLARSGVHPRIMQALARHSDPRLTLGRYTHTELGEQSEAVALLPELNDPSACEQRATGTLDPIAVDSVLASCLAQRDSESLSDVHSGAVVEGSIQANSAHEKTPEDHDENRVSQGFSAERAGNHEASRRDCQPQAVNLCYKETFVGLDVFGMLSVSPVFSTLTATKMLQTISFDCGIIHRLTLAYRRLIKLVLTPSFP